MKRKKRPIEKTQSVHPDETNLLKLKTIKKKRRLKIARNVYWIILLILIADCRHVLYTGVGSHYMKEILLTILLLSTSTSLYCQGTGKLIVKSVTELEDKLDKRDLVLKKSNERQADDKNSYRIWTDSQLIELTKSNDSLYFGQIVSFIFKIITFIE